MAVRQDALPLAGAAQASTVVQRSTVFARAAAPPDQAASVPEPMTSSPFLDAMSLSRAALVLRAVALPFAFWFKPICLLIATLWLFYRAYQVLNKPLDELAGLLGFDIPSTPTIDLASIRADGAIIHWSLPDKQRHKSTLKFEIHLNGALIDTVSIHESAATITGLQPGCFYVVRVSLVNSIEFASKSAPIRFRTKPAASGDFFVPLPDTHDLDHDTVQDAVPRVRPFRGLTDITPASPDSTPLSREGSNATGPRRSIVGSRRFSPVGPGTERRENPSEDSEPPEGAETIQHLTEKLDALRRETDDAERLAKDEDEEELRQKDELAKERDELRAEVSEKEKASRNLKREVNTLERQNTAAQNERTKHERILQQKKLDRQKLKDDMVRWEREAVEMENDVERIGEFKATQLRKADEEAETLQAKQCEESAAIKALDEEVKEKNAEIKKLERAIKSLLPNGTDSEPNLVQQLQQDAEEKRAWDMHYAALQQQYAISVQKLEQTKRFYAEQSAYLESLRARRRQEEAAHYVSPPPTQERLPRRADSQRSRRAQSGQSASESPRLTNFAMSSSAFAPGMTSTASVFQNAPFLNIHNGMTISGPSDAHTMSDEDKDRLTGGALMSPGAGAELLPADLFMDGDNRQSTELVQPLPGLGSLPGLPGLPGAAPPIVQEHPGTGPASPASASSRSPSVFASPQASQQNLHLGSPENLIDADRRSIRSTRSNRATSGGGYGSRFSGMFGIKQRAKTNPLEEGLALGKTQSHSMPRQDQGIPGIDSNSRKRNSSISGSLYDTNYSADAPYDAAPEAAPSSRRKAFNIFSKEKSDGWPSTFTGFGRRPASPRPGSTHSNELPRPSSDASRWGVDAWPANDATRGSPLAFGAGWNTPGAQQSRLFGSRHPSRRPSVQYGGSAPPEDIIEDEDLDVIDARRAAYLAPIGTRPPVGSSGADKLSIDDVPKLNPNAKDFKSFFSSIKLRDKGKESGGATPSSSVVPNVDAPEHDDSPPASRKSRDTRDTRSMTTTESSVAESGRNSVDLVRTASYSTSDAAVPSPLLTGSSFGKESFMSKLTRKSSSGGKFTLPTFKRDKTRLDPGSATSAHFEDDEDSMSASLSSLKEREPRESKEAARGSGRGWSNVLKIGKKKGNETPSLSGLSLTSGADDGEEDEEGDDD